MADVLALVVMIALIVLTVWLVQLCDRLREL
jgi:hypothetical protein